MVDGIPPVPSQVRILPAHRIDNPLSGGAVRLILHRIFGRHTVAYYTDNARYTRGVCWGGVEGALDAYGRFL